MLVDRFNRPLKKDDLVLMTTHSVYTDQLEYAIVENVQKDKLFYYIPYYDYISEIDCNHEVFKVENPCEYEINLRNKLMKRIIVQRKQIAEYEKLKRQLSIGSIIINRTSGETFLYLGRASGIKTYPKDDDYQYFDGKRYAYVNLFRDIETLNSLLYNKDNPEYIKQNLTKLIRWTNSFTFSINPKANCYFVDKIDLSLFSTSEKICIDYTNYGNSFRMMILYKELL